MRRRFPRRRRHWVQRGRRWHQVLHLYWRHKAIATSAYGAQEPLAVIAKRLPDVHDVAIERRIPHSLAWPHMLEQFLLEDYPVIMRQEIGQHLIYLGPQRDGHTVPVQLIALSIEAIVAKDIAHWHMLRPSRGTSFRPEHRSSMHLTTKIS